MFVTKYYNILRNSTEEYLAPLRSKEENNSVNKLQLKSDFFLSPCWSGYFHFNISILTLVLSSSVLYIWHLLILSPQFEAGDCSSSPSMPPLSLAVCEHQGATLGNDASSLDKTTLEMRSTTRQMTTGRCHSAKLPTKPSPTQNSCTIITDSNNQLHVSDGPPSGLSATTSGKPQSFASLDVNKQPPESQYAAGSPLTSCIGHGPPAIRTSPNGLMPTVLSASASASATQEQLPTLPHVTPGNRNDSLVKTFGW